MPHGITQCYLPPGRGDIPALTPAEAGTRLSDPGGMQGWVDLWLVWLVYRRRRGRPGWLVVVDREGRAMISSSRSSCRRRAGSDGGRRPWRDGSTAHAARRPASSSELGRPHDPPLSRTCHHHHRHHQGVTSGHHYVPVITSCYSSRTAALQPINFVTLTRVTNNASCNWVNLVQVSSVQFHVVVVVYGLCLIQKDWVIDCVKCTAQNVSRICAERTAISCSYSYFV